MVKAIIFDFDGLILDTETHEYEVLQEMFAEHESELPLSVWGNVIGTQAGFKPFEYLEKQLGKTLDHEALTADRRSRFQKENEGRISTTWRRSLFTGSEGAWDQD